MTQYNVFVSHSMTQDDLGIIYQAKRDAECRGITCYIAERDPQFGKSLSNKIENAIRLCDCCVVFLTHGGSSSAYVNQEIGFAKACGRLIIKVVENGVQVKGFDVDNEYLPLDRQNPAAAISSLNDYLSARRDQKEKEIQKRNPGLSVVGAAPSLAFLAGGKQS